MIGTSSSSSTEAWLVHPEPDIWLAPSSSTTSFGLEGTSLAAPGDKWGAWVEEEEADSASGTGDETQAAAAAAVSLDASFTSLQEGKSFEI